MPELQGPPLTIQTKEAREYQSRARHKKEGSHMSEESYQEGDLVEAVRGERRVTDRIVTDHDGDLYLPGAGQITYRAMPESTVFKAGYTITVIEKAKPPVVLPTEPGFYLDKEGDAWRVNSRGTLICQGYPRAKAESCAPFTRLAPVSEVLSKVVREWVTGRNTTLTESAEAVAAEYGAAL